MKKLATLITIVLLSASCQNYLEIQPRGSAIPRTAEDYSALLNTLLEEVDNSRSVVVGGYKTVFDLECFADDLDANMLNLAGAPYVKPYIGREYEASGNYTSNYSKAYATINICNVIIQGLANDKTALAQDVIGASYAIRGICYYELLRQFCEAYDANATTQLGMPIVLEPDMEARPIRSSMQALMQLIEDDLLAAREHDVQDSMFRFSKDVVDGYLARFYFWTEQYAKAITMADRVLKAYPLLNGEAYKEMVTTPIGKKGNVIIKSAMITSIEVRNDITDIKLRCSYRPVNIKCARLFVEKDKDIRYGLWYGISRSDWRLAQKFPFAGMRSAEMCLILAESYYHENNTTEALQWLNTLRNNRITNNVEFTEASLPALRNDEPITVDAKGNSLTPLLYAIHCERRKELFLEGDRWYELKRNGSPEFWIGHNGRKLVTEKFMYTSPLPYHDVIQIPGMVQNPGYNQLIN